VTEYHVAWSVPGLDEAALEALRQWTFKPARLNGEPVDAVAVYPVRFTLH
jgi:TonB family protein